MNVVPDAGADADALVLVPVSAVPDWYSRWMPALCGVAVPVSSRRSRPAWPGPAAEAGVEAETKPLYSPLSTCSLSVSTVVDSKSSMPRTFGFLEGGKIPAVKYQRSFITMCEPSWRPKQANT